MAPGKKKPAANKITDPKIVVTVGVTYNLGNYESLRLDIELGGGLVGVSDPTVIHEALTKSALDLLDTQHGLAMKHRLVTG